MKRKVSTLMFVILALVVFSNKAMAANTGNSVNTYPFRTITTQELVLRQETWDSDPSDDPVIDVIPKGSIVSVEFPYSITYDTSSITFNGKQGHILNRFLKPSGHIFTKVSYGSLPIPQDEILEFWGYDPNDSSKIVIYYDCGLYSIPESIVNFCDTDTSLPISYCEGYSYPLCTVTTQPLFLQEETFDQTPVDDPIIAEIPKGSIVTVLESYSSEFDHVRVTFDGKQGHILNRTLKPSGYILTNASYGMVPNDMILEFWGYDPLNPTRVIVSYMDYLLSIPEDTVSKDFIHVVEDPSTPDSKLQMIKNTQILITAKCTTGMKGVTSTPKGTAKVCEKAKKVTLMLNSKADFGLKLQYEHHNYRGYYIHDADRWRTSNEYGGKNYIYNGSHGCINLSRHDMQIVYNYADLGIRVLIEEKAGSLNLNKKSILGSLI